MKFLYAVVAIVCIMAVMSTTVHAQTTADVCSSLKTIFECRKYPLVCTWKRQFLKLQCVSVLSSLSEEASLPEPLDVSALSEEASLPQPLDVSALSEASDLSLETVDEADPSLGPADGVQMDIQLYSKLVIDPDTGLYYYQVDDEQLVQIDSEALHTILSESESVMYAQQAVLEYKKKQDATPYMFYAMLAVGAILLCVGGVLGGKKIYAAMKARKISHKTSDPAASQSLLAPESLDAQEYTPVV